MRTKVEKEVRHAEHIKYNYGITINQYNKLFEEQEGKCAICHKHQLDFKRKFSVDHNHETGEVRGLLCSNCNTLLGLAKEKEEVLFEAIQYLKKYE